MSPASAFGIRRAGGFGRGSVGDKAAIDRKNRTEDETCARTTQPKYGGCDLVRATHAPNGLLLEKNLHGAGVDGDPHGRIDATWANGVHADAGRGIVHSGALCEADHAMFAGMIGGPTRQTHQAP